jgi:hypothetical protein
MDNDLQQAVTLIKSGDKTRGGQILAEIVKRDPRNENAWLWLASCVSTNEKKIYCLKKVLVIDPNNQVAFDTLSKLVQLEQPSEKEILEQREQPRQEVQQPSGGSQTNIVSLKAQKKKSSTFEPKYLTAVAGIGVMIGTVFPWSALVSVSGPFNTIQATLKEYSGLTLPIGIFTCIVGLSIIFISIFQKTKPGKPNSLISSIFALLIFLAIIVLSIFSYQPCMPNPNCIIFGTGFGYGLSLFSLFLTHIFGLIPNPKNE